MNNRVGFQGRLRQPVRIMVGGALAVVLAACGGNNNSTNTQVPNSFLYAVNVLGHADYNSYKPNQTSFNGAIGASAATLSNPSGSVATDGSHFYIADTNNHRILGWNSVPTSAGQSADFIIGQSQSDVTTPGTSQTALSYPSKVSISDDGRLVVADTGNNRVLIWNSLPTSNDVPADIVIGQSDFNSGDPNQDNQAPSGHSLSNPTAAVIAKNRLFIIDNNNNRMLVWNLTNNPLPTGTGLTATYNVDADFAWGQPDLINYTPNCGQGTVDPGKGNQIDCYLGNYPISQYSLNQPEDLWTDGTRLFVSDTSNNRVLFWSQIPLSNLSLPAFVMGQGTFTSGATGGSGQSGMSAPYSVASDGSRVFIADTGNNRVLVYDNFPAASAPNADTVLGQNYWNYKTANDDNQDQQQDANPTGRTLSRPTGVFALGGATEQLFVSDYGNNRVLEFNPQ